MAQIPSAPSASASTSSNHAPQRSPSPGWLRSIDAVYDLFEDPKVAQQYPQLSFKVETAVRLCEEVIQEVGWGHCALSFNGGKDCTVLVHILSAVQRRILGLSSRTNAHTHTANTNSSNRTSASSSTSPLPPIRSLYITCPSPFPTVEKFIAFSASPVYGYNLDLVSVSGGMKEGLRLYLSGGGTKQIGLGQKHEQQETAQPPAASDPAPELASDHRDVRACFIGTRRDDPHGPSLSPRSWTDSDWPRVERIHPILTWTYKDVWDFLRCAHLSNPDAVQTSNRQELAERYGVAGGGDEGVPYCLLYEQGYTSLGSTFNTHPNPVLKIDSAGNAPVPSSSKDTNGHDPHPASVVVGDGTARGRWKPAYMLQDGSLERAGREGSNKPKDVSDGAEGRTATAARS